MSPFEVYQNYLSLKSHFTNPKYDYFKYNKKVRATLTSFNKRKDKYFFEKSSRKYSDKEVVDFLVSNFVAADNPQNLWIGEIINSGERTYAEWMRRQQSLTYLFKEQSNELFSETKLEDALNCSKGHPPILKSFLSGKICLETLVIYDRIFQFSKRFDKKLLDPVWETVSLKISKYSPFLNTDIFQYKRILREIINE
ncbi:loader of DNA helicase [Synechococcus phage S-SRM01]|uniref:Loader of DNA helicase n=1 Tax=Synechococcus phage S-SRM01 TaxID=2781608 RepID=A0A879R1B9_9CAUD|nr:loader of DNA helicase [Synechococcus phage S-SRM01]QPX47993.1 loader of DNA helicase [Synechococcus phage S-SRM01]